MESILTGEHLKKTYGSKEKKIKAVDDISISIQRGEFTSIIGRSGSGKSTLLHMLGGLIMPQSGTVKLNNQDLSKLTDRNLTLLRRRKMGFIFQFFNLVPTQNVIENIVLPIHLDGRKEDQQFIDELISLLGLEEKRYSYIHELSGGLQQRVAIARALASKPEIIFADEPTGNLDEESAAEVIRLLRMTQRKYRQTVLMVTHNLEIAAKTDRIVMLENGKIIKDMHR
ncbi:MAG: ABC transporter ATP-binding protein [Erysipelotrichaceae bacterium]|nr:ABC transporter ATP-binding protein [Erysipelotrichaceae bacterium]